MSPLERRTPLRVDLEKLRAWRRRSKPLSRESAKRRAERPARRRVAAEARERAGGCCEVAELLPDVACWGPLDPHEIESRGTHPGSHLRGEVVVAACRNHHDHIHHVMPKADAYRLGLLTRRTEIRDER